jgi:hypothetical protein
MPKPTKEAAKAKVRAKGEARKQMPAREYLADLLHATLTHNEADALLDRFEGESPNARLSAVMDICDEAERDGAEYVNVHRIHRAALGDKLKRPTFPGGGF